MSLRIVTTSPATRGQALMGVPAAATPPALDSYLERLVKLVPAESICAYPLLSGYAGAQGLWAEVLVSWVLLVVSGVLRWHATKGGTGQPQWPALAVALVSFVIWVGVMGGHFGITALIGWLGLGSLAEALAAASEFLTVLALVIWTILIPVFYQGDG